MCDLWFSRRYWLCSVEVCLCAPFCRVSLCPCEGAGCSQRLGMLCRRPVFAFLTPGAYCLRAWGGGRECQVLLRLPPGANIALRVGSDGQVQWYREPYRCLYNLE